MERRRPISVGEKNDIFKGAVKKQVPEISIVDGFIGEREILVFERIPFDAESLIRRIKGEKNNE